MFVALYFELVLLPSNVWDEFDAWKETLLAGRFAAGVLFSMLAAAGLGTTWLSRKARIVIVKRLIGGVNEQSVKPAE